MLKFFNKSFFTQYITIFVLGLLLWLPAAFLQTGIETPQNSSGTVSHITDYINNNFPVLGAIATFLLTIIAGLFINKMANHYNLTGKTSTLPLFVFILISGFSPLFHSFTLFTITLPFTTLFYSLIFKHYHKGGNIFLSFDTGMTVGILTLLYPPLLLLIFILWFSLLSFKGISWRNFTAGLFGLLFPLFLIYSYYFFSGQESAFLNLVPSDIYLSLNNNLFHLTLNTVLILLLSVFIFISAVKVLQQQKNLTIRKRSYYSVVSFSLFLLLFIQLFLSKQYSAVLLLAPAGALTISNLLNNSSLKPKWINLLFVIFILISLTNVYLPYLYVTQ